MHSLETTKTPKLLLLWDRMGDYHRARWQALSQLIGADNCLAADYGMGDGLYQWENTRQSDKYFCLVAKPVEEVGAWEAFSAFRQLVKGQNITHVCIPGYGRPAYILMLLWARLKGLQILMFAESWYPSNRLADWAKGLLIRATTNVCFVSGKRAAAHFSRRLNFPAKHIIEGYSVVDNQHFAHRKSEAAASAKPQLLCVARHAPEKNLGLLIDAFKQSHLAYTWQLRIVGGGPLKENLSQQIGDSDVLLDDWLPYGALPDMYAAATCFILPSSFEPWGLVVNEAMAAGLPIILSDAVGALPDLLTPENGWSFNHNSVADCVRCLNQLAATSPDQLSQMGASSRQIIQAFTPATWADKVYLSYFSYLSAK
jgi:1,2-diacylglycerol 3-alpha-glucosyltransferase